MKDLDLSVFPYVSKDDWHKLAEDQLLGEDPNEKLHWQNLAGMSLDPYYDHSDLEGCSYLIDFFSGIPKHRWKLYERVSVHEEGAANRLAIAALMGGCDGVIFQSEKPLNEDILLKDIDPTICDLSFEGNMPVTAAIHANTGFLATSESANCLKTSQNENPLVQIREIVEGLTNQSFISRRGFEDFFLEIATIRAIRYLTRSNANLHIHTQIKKHDSQEKQWFLNTSSGLAAILGGTHSVEFATATGDPRISRNTGNLIREESGIETYNDPCGGTYYIEVLTDKLIKQTEK